MKKHFLRIANAVDLRFILLVVFAAVSVWLSFSYRQQMAQAADYRYQLRWYDNELSFTRFSMMSLDDAFRDNLSRVGMLADGAGVHIFNHLEPAARPVLYLNQDACSECYHETLISIVNYFYDCDRFTIVSHPLNEPFLQKLAAKEFIRDIELVTWSVDPLYANGSLYPEAQLILFDEDMRTRAVFTLDFMKDSGFMCQYLNWIEEVVTNI
ncbi:MAG: hypothetical protein EA394_10135 [Bacteroidia bacterium]|nr:MAG: hypothetical protein EA394_10135 [Bacteroidia bacterium]